MTDAQLYETDIVAWAEEQARAVRELGHRPDLSNVLDRPNIAEEIDSVGRSQALSVERKLVLVLVHLIAIISAPDAPASRGWRNEIVNFQRVARKQYSRSMSRLIDPAELWGDALKEAQGALALWGDDLIRGLPSRNPFTIDELVSGEFDLHDALSKLVDALDPPAGG